MKRQQISRLDLASYLLSPSLFVMVILMVVEAMLAAAKRGYESRRSLTAYDRKFKHVLRAGAGDFAFNQRLCLKA